MTADRKTAPDPLAEDFLELFLEEEECWGTFDVERLHLVGDKVEMKDEKGQGPRDVKRPPTVADMRAHLDGKVPMGLRPVDRYGMTRRIVIDIDGRDAPKGGGYRGLSQFEIVKKIIAFKLPPVDHRSKSGGIHLDVFLDEKVTQAQANAWGRQIAELLDVPKAEVFPPAEGRGNWIIVPYIDCDNQMSGLFGLKRPPGSGKFEAAEYAAFAKASRVSPAALEIAIRQARRHKADGGPELANRKLAEFLTEIVECREGGRAKLLYGRAKDLGAYVGAGWLDSDVVFKALMRAATFENIMPLPQAEAAMHITNGLRDGNHDKPQVGSDGRYVKFASMIRWLGGDEPELEVMVEGFEGSLRKPVKEITNQILFNDHCVAQWGQRYRKMKQNDWDDAIAAALAGAGVRQVEPDETPEWMFHETLRAYSRDYNPWRDNKMHEFTISDLAWDRGKAVPIEDEGRIYYLFGEFHKYFISHAPMYKGWSALRLGRMLKTLGVEGVDYGKTTKKLRGPDSKLVEVRWVRIDLFDETPRRPTEPVPADPLG